MICKAYITLFLSFMCLANLCFSQSKETNPMNSLPQKNKHPVVLITTSLGDIKVELYEDKAPISVKNFLQYVKDGHYDNTIFHRVIDGFMIQGGGFTKDFKQKPTKAPIAIESDNGLKNTRGTLAMARTSDVNSATSQFFINVADNSFLDFRGKNSRDYGYAVFGKVIEGMDVVEKIKKVKTGSHDSYQDVPEKTIEIIKVTEY